MPYQFNILFFQNFGKRISTGADFSNKKHSVITMKICEDAKMQEYILPENLTRNFKTHNFKLPIVWNYML